VEVKEKERLLAVLVGQLKLVKFHPMLTPIVNVISKRTVTDVTTLTITAGPRGGYVYPQEGSLIEGDEVSLPLQVASTSEGVKLNTSSEETSLDIKAEGVKRGEIRVDGGLRGEVDDRRGLASGVLVTAKARQISISVCVQTPPTLISSQSNAHVYIHSEFSKGRSLSGRRGPP
jgi:hypothetical protein